MKVLITGGCGFIGANIAKRHLLKNDEVIIIDDLSRLGAVDNLDRIRKLNQQLRGNLKLIKKDINSPELMWKIRDMNVDLIYHMAAQVAVTSSIRNPWADFMTNAQGTLWMLEAARLSKSDPFFIYASTNKVYGEMPDVPVSENETRYFYKDITGIGEDRATDFHSPYGCSKGAADQYVRDYGRVYGLDTAVFRQSCIYGEMQTGIEDQGWLSWFCQKTKEDKTIKIYGTGKQVRDVLYIDDLLNLYDKAFENRDISSGQIYNTGGGPDNTLSLLELVEELEDVSGKIINLEYFPAREGDQKVYISDITKAKSLGWEPTVCPKEGIRRLYDWTVTNL